MLLGKERMENNPLDDGITRESFHAGITKAMADKKNEKYTHQQRVDFYMQVEADFQRAMSNPSPYKVDPNYGVGG